MLLSVTDLRSTGLKKMGLPTSSEQDKRQGVEEKKLVAFCECTQEKRQSPNRGWD